MTNVAVIGSQWGDEGKGKIVDWLSERADVVVRFQGGHNAGHTLVIDGEVYKLSLLPSGIVRKGKISIIGNGVVIDPRALIDEMNMIKRQGVSITPESFMISEHACLILPWHQQQDSASESDLGSQKIGTTGRGIGPAYEDKVGRRAIRMCDLLEPEYLKSRLENILEHHNILRRGRDLEPLTLEPVEELLKLVAKDLTPFIKPVWRELDKFRNEGKRILFEGAQGVMLDNDYGTYPFVTSSNTIAGQCFTGSGFGVGNIGTVLGITKAYTTRVGSGPFPTEQDNEIGQKIGERGHEFGTVTGRQRRCGWFDAVMVKQAMKVSGINAIAFTKLDVLDGLEEIKICTGYKYKGKKYDYLPASPIIQEQIEPIYETLPGWSETTEGARSFADLPGNAVKYIRRIEELVDTFITLVSTSPERDDTILIRDPFDY